MLMLIRWVLIGLLIAVGIRAINRLLSGLLAGAGYTRQPAGRGRRGTAVRLVRDPVCGMHVVPSETLSLGTGDARQYFCSERCRDRYLAERARA
jgi:YHS domain-containing protein